MKPFNPRKAVAFADNKLKTKAFLAARGVPTAKIYARIENRNQLRDFDFSQLPDECVLKPNYGFGGEGILVLNGRKNGTFFRGKEPLSNQEIFQHIEDILDGMFSISGRRDTAFFEQILIPHECFARFRPAGLPDIRVIVFNMVPVMAMLRIPTAQSDGKANIHLGGIGIGIDLAKGVTTHAAQYHGIIGQLPHGGSPSGIQIPHWEEILTISSRIQQITNIGYLAVDITIDQDVGPALLEVNARAGLMVQVANLAPLRARLKRVKGIRVDSPEKGVRIGQDLFGEGKKVESDKAETPDGKTVLGTREHIVISGDGVNIEVPSLIAPEHERTVFSPELIAELSEADALEPEGEKDRTFRVKFTLAGKKMQTLVGVEEMAGPERAKIGKRDLTGFLIDLSKETPQGMGRTSVKADLRAVDKLYAQIDRDLLLLKYIKPANLEEERIRLEQDKTYNPLFHYRELDVEAEDVKRKLDKPIQNTSPLGILLEKKRQELLTRMEMLQSRGNATRFTQQSKALFGGPTTALLREAQSALDARVACDVPATETVLLSSEEAKVLLTQALERYSLHDWDVSVRPRLVADCTVGGNKVYLREGARFEPLHIEALIAHEIETHILTAENGAHQAYMLFRNGCANYLDTQEGMAIYNQNRVYGPFHEKRYNPPRNLLGLAFGLEHSFAKTREYLEEELGYDPEKALHQALAVKRGLRDTTEPGGFTKSVVYFRGFRAIEHFVASGGDLTLLYVGRIALEDLKLIGEMEDLEPPLLLPSFLREAKEEVKAKSKAKKTPKKKKTQVKESDEEVVE
ncbi:hypothetical protein COU76_05830 [Candidatus Peregrinibacteria bacterium CG10_big_fil_rev_8_21_14_0_10_49_10]|nr:MAG: hypothetical protein COU76_05830 [Candidatus Peregrinibacteria bacterium CG10_big_fil_rev_8_21_14_0_10_49_10]